MQLSKKSLPEFSGTKREGLKNRVDAFYELLAHIYGADKLILKATKLEALALLRSRNLRKKVLGLQKVILKTRHWINTGSPGNSFHFERVGRACRPYFGRRSLEESIEQKINLKLQERHEEYIREVKKQLLKEEGGPRIPRR